MKNILFSLLIVLTFSVSNTFAQSDMKLGLLKYNGGGDWYSNPTALPNLAKFCNTYLKTKLNPSYETVEVGSADIFELPFLYMTGHGNVVFSDQEAKNLRQYLLGGGFLHIDDNYGMDPFVRSAMKKVFPELEFIELPPNHPVYNTHFEFPNGIPKIHKHDNKPAEGLALIWEDKLICFYSYESDLGNGWENQEVHNDPPEVRTQALKMGANLVKYAFER